MSSSSINLTANSIEKCIICQKTTEVSPSFTVNGRQKVLAAANIRKDDVSKLIALLGENFVVTKITHINNIWKE